MLIVFHRQRGIILLNVRFRMHQNSAASVKKVALKNQYVRTNSKFVQLILRLWNGTLNFLSNFFLTILKGFFFVVVGCYSLTTEH